MNGFLVKLPNITGSDFEVNVMHKSGTFGNGLIRRTRFSTSEKISSNKSTHQLLPEHEGSFHSINFDYIVI